MEPVLHVPAFQDNYIWLIRGRSPDRVAIVDPGDAAPVLAALAERRLTPVAILCTHHHADHVGGVAELLAQFPVPVYGPARERIEGVSHPLAEGARVIVPELGLDFAVLDIPAHTAGHIAYHGGGLLFCGDTLFSAGCGRLFEGSAAQMAQSLAKLAALPDDTAVYCGHEYTAANLRFALAVEPDNRAAQAHLAQVLAWRAAGRPSLPSTVGRERRINPFLRTHEPAVRAAAERHAGRALATATEVFGVLRAWKDGFSE
ncbi:MAG: hydroxyacylglutathione hydrolase [Gammaproteobacteria bacterium]|nr:hydroxyacylglutathione hydrolase [Gammaproteobacteria bacterium]